MEPENSEEFLRWFDGELSKLHLTDYQFAQLAGITHPVISKARKGKLPGWNSCVKIAIALHVDPVEVFRMVGLLPKRRNRTLEVGNLVYLCENLPEEYVAIALRLIKALPEE